MAIRMNKRVLWIALIIGAIFLINPGMRIPTFSTVSWSGLSEEQCADKETTCFDNNGLLGKLVDCHIGSGNKCYCEFQSYSRGVCPEGESPTDSSDSMDTIVTSGEDTSGVVEDATEVAELDFKNLFSGGIKVGSIFIPTWIIIVVVVFLFLILLVKGQRGVGGFGGLKPTGGTITLGKGK